MVLVYWPGGVGFPDEIISIITSMGGVAEFLFMGILMEFLANDMKCIILTSKVADRVD